MHAILNPEAAMNVLRPNTAIEQLLTEFLADHTSRLTPETHRRYARVLDLIEFSLERYRPGRRRETPDATVEPFCATYGVAELARSFSWFLNVFLVHEIRANPETLQTAKVVIQTLGAWLNAKGYIVRNEAVRKRTKTDERPPYFPGFFQD